MVDPVDDSVRPSVVRRLALVVALALVAAVGWGAGTPALADIVPVTTGVAWGDGGAGRLGTATTVPSPAPTAMATPPGSLSRVSAGYAHACGIHRGRAYCWGSNAFGALGAGDRGDSSTPVAVDTTGILAGQTVIDVSAGRGFTCVVTSQGLVACWGANFFGTLGHGTYVSSSVPVSTSGALTGQRAVAVSSGDDHACALLSDGTAACWGRNDVGQLGNGGQVDSAVPVRVTQSGSLSAARFTMLSAGATHTCAATNGGLGYCWGGNDEGQLGIGTQSPSEFPVRISLSGALETSLVIGVSAGTAHTCAQLAYAPWALCWGSNLHGQLGDGTTVSRLTPVVVAQGAQVAGRSLVEVEAGSTSTCAVDEVRRALCWGGNASGELGTGGGQGSLTPVGVNRNGALAGREVAHLSVGNRFVVAALTALLAPGRPTSVRVTAGAQRLLVTWVAPGTSGTQPVIGYQAIASQVGTSTSRTCSVSAARRSCWITGLTNGVGYTVRVISRSHLGESVPSVASAPVVPGVPPSTPRLVRATAQLSRVLVTWQHPTSSGSSSVVGYDVRALTSQGLAARVCTVSSSRKYCVVKGLTKGREYTFQVRARNLSTWGSWSRPSTSITAK